MAGTADLPKALQPLVKDVGRPVTSEDVDAYRKWRRIEDESYRLRTVLREWKDQQSQDRTLRSRYALWLMIAMGLQIIAINLIYLLIGCGVLKYEQWTANTFIMAVFAEIAALVLLVVKYLFTPSGDRVLDLMRDQHEGNKQNG